VDPIATLFSEDLVGLEERAFRPESGFGVRR
jgi:hypothetical protein